MAKTGLTKGKAGAADDAVLGSVTENLPGPVAAQADGGTAGRAGVTEVSVKLQQVLAACSEGSNGHRRRGEGRPSIHRNTMNKRALL